MIFLLKQITLYVECLLTFKKKFAKITSPEVQKKVEICKNNTNKILCFLALFDKMFVFTAS